MDMIKYINSNLLDRYAQWIAEEDMKKYGVKVIKIDSINQVKEKTHG